MFYINWIITILNNTNLLVPAQQLGHEQAVRRSGLELTEADNWLHRDFNFIDCFLTTVHLLQSPPPST